MSNELPADVIRIHLDTTERFSAQLAGQIIASAADTIQSSLDLRERWQIVLLESGESSWWAHLMVIAGSGVAFAGSTVLAIEAMQKEAKEGQTPFSRGVAAALEEGDGRTLTITAGTEQRVATSNEMIAYPPPVGEDQAAFLRGYREGPDWASAPLQSSSGHPDGDPNIENNRITSALEDLEEASFDPMEGVIDPTEIENKWDSEREISFDLTDLRTPLNITRSVSSVAGKYRDGFNYPIVQSSEQLVVLLGIPIELPIEEGVPLNVVGYPAESRDGRYLFMYPTKISGPSRLSDGVKSSVGVTTLLRDQFDEILTSNNEPAVIVPASLKDAPIQSFEGVIQRRGRSLNGIVLVAGKLGLTIEGLQIDVDLQDGDLVKLSGKREGVGSQIYPTSFFVLERPSAPRSN